MYAQYVPWVYMTPLPEPTEDGWCVSFVRSHGFEEYNGDAHTWKRFINALEPIVGSAIVLDEGTDGHVALITAVSSGSLDLIEQNFEGLGIVSTRSLDRFSTSIVGYIHPKSQK